jgi:hypothetical protein
MAKTEWNWPDFRPAEVLSPQGLHVYRNEGLLLFSPLMLACLQAFRNQLDKPILINYDNLRLRGYRSCAENRNAGGKAFSLHLQGLAADCTVPGLTSSELVEKAINSKLFNGIGQYETFVHLDCRHITDDKVRRWEG